MPQISLVIPAYNEESRLPLSLDTLSQFIVEKKFNDLEITSTIVVDDGSNDQTTKVAKLYRDKIPNLTVHTLPNNRGKGYAVKTGIGLATTEWVLIADADMSTPWTELNKLYAELTKQSADLAMGSRDIKGSQVTRHQSFLRENLGKSFNVAVRSLTGVPFKDTQCGFKLVRTKAAQEILPVLTIDRFAWDVEFILLLLRNGKKVIEVPVTWEHRDESRVRMLRDGINMLYSIIKVRIGLFLNRSKTEKVLLP